MPGSVFQGNSCSEFDHASRKVAPRRVATPWRV